MPKFPAMYYYSNDINSLGHELILKMVATIVNALAISLLPINVHNIHDIHVHVHVHVQMYMLLCPCSFS